MRFTHSALPNPGRHQHSRRRHWRAVAGLASVAFLATSLVGCSDDVEPTPQQSTTDLQSGDPTPEPGDAEPTAEETELAELIPEVPDVPRVEVTKVDVVAERLSAPWGLARLPTGDYLITLRDDAEVVRIDQDTGAKTTLTGAGATELAANTASAGEGGLLGLALSPEFRQDQQIFVYRTAAEGNEVLSGTVTGNELSALDVVIDGIPHADTHNGGGLAFGPDGHLYIGTGDAGVPEDAQDVASLAGKILRVAPDGAIPSDNPMPGLPAWSTGHRNVQGFGWDGRERMYASEFGAADFDELNVIRSGGNYGWPQFEGPGGADQGFIDPLKSWPPASASPSGVAVNGEGIYLAALRGQRLWRVPLSQVVSGEPLAGQVLLEGEYGRIRNVLSLAGGDLLVLTNNTDGRGEPGKGDDQLLRVQVTPVERSAQAIEELGDPEEADEVVEPEAAGDSEPAE